MRTYQISVSLPTDDRGMLGRQCPACGRYFKLKPGTVLPTSLCRCPYSEHRGDSQDFSTRDQLAYAESVAVREFDRGDNRRELVGELGRPALAGHVRREFA